MTRNSVVNRLARIDAPRCVTRFRDNVLGIADYASPALVR